MHRLDQNSKTIYTTLFSNENDSWATYAHGEGWDKAFTDGGAYIHDSGGKAIKSGCMKNKFDITGHARPYGKCGGPNEDQATVAETLFKNEKEFFDRLKKDPILAKKVQMIKELYYIKSEGQMDQQYWQDRRHNVKIDQNYWKKRVDKEGALGYDQKTPYYFFVEAVHLQNKGSEAKLIARTKQYPHRAEYNEALSNLYKKMIDKAFKKIPIVEKRRALGSRRVDVSSLEKLLRSKRFSDKYPTIMDLYQKKSEQDKKLIENGGKVLNKSLFKGISDLIKERL